MDNQTITPNTNGATNFKDFIIFVLVIAFVLSILGINIFVYVGQFIKFVASLFIPLFSSVGYATGTVLNTTSDLATDTTKFGIDVADGTIHDIGNLMISASDKNAIPDFKHEYNKYSASLLGGVSKAIATNPAQQSPSPSPIMVFGTGQQSPSPSPSPIMVSSPTMNIQNIIDTPPPKYMNNVSSDQSNSIIQSQSKTNWCLIGEYKDRRGCVEVDDADRCISGQIFPSQQQCLQPQFMTTVHT